MNMKYIIEISIIGIVGMLILITGCSDKGLEPEAPVEINNFEDCIAAGNPAMESYPRQCAVPGGNTFVEEVPPVEPPTAPEEDFCGSSTEAECDFDSDCKTAGCSGQICQGVKEEESFSTCEYKDCYNEETYGVSCGCVEGSCQWA